MFLKRSRLRFLVRSPWITSPAYTYSSGWDRGYGSKVPPYSFEFNPLDAGWTAQRGHPYHKVGTSRCDVTARLQRAERMQADVAWSFTRHGAAERGADGAARPSLPNPRVPYF